MDLMGLLKVVKETERAIVIPHVDPDGDTLGSCLALCLGLRQLGTDCWIVTDEPIPGNLSLLPMEGAQVSCSAFVPCGDYTAFSIDSGDKGRLGSSVDLFDSAKRTVNIDHHPTNPGYGAVNLVDPEASSTAEIIYGLLDPLGIPMTPDIAGALYLGLASDTGCFRYRNTTPSALAIGAKLVAAGADPALIAEELYEKKSFPYLKLLGSFLNSLLTDMDGELAWGVITLNSISDFGVPESEVDGLVSYARMIKGSEVAVVFKEHSSGRVKISLRSKEKVDVSAIAASFGGGGHKRASGATVEGALDEVVERVLDMIRGILSRS